jgi:hypothetical protein
LSRIANAEGKRVLKNLAARSEACLLTESVRQLTVLATLPARLLSDLHWYDIQRYRRQ